MEEFDLEGLPLFILANWRGFSGGQRDLFEGVLQVRLLCTDPAALTHLRQTGNLGPKGDIFFRQGLSCYMLCASSAEPHVTSPALSIGKV